MKRTPMKRKTRLQARKQMKRTAGLKSEPSARKPRRKATTDKRWRSPEYLDWVRARPCAFCALGPCDPHHVIGLGWGLSGMGLTAPDSFAMPLCRVHHDAVHAKPGLQRAQVDWLRWTLRAALADKTAFDGETQEQLLHALAFVEAQEART